MAPWTNKTGLAKAAAILATAFGVSLGLCGANFIAVISFAPTIGPNWQGPIGNILTVTAWAELAAMGLSATGLVIVGVMAAVRTLSKRNDGEGR